MNAPSRSTRVALVELGLLCVAIAAVLIIAATPASDAVAEQTVVLEGATVFDGNGGDPVASARIVIAGEKLADVGHADKVPLPQDVSRIDYSGKFIIPGLISVHSHVGQVDGIENGSINYNRENILRQLRQYEAYGVTTVTALGVNGPLFYEIQKSLHQGELPGADLFGADRGIGVAGGAPPEAALKVTADQLDRPNTPDEARAAVRAAKQRGADLIKFWLDDFAGSLPRKMPPEIYMAIIDEAHRQNLRVAAHVFYLDDAKAVVRAGVDILAHGVRDRPVDKQFTELLIHHAVWYVPTLSADESNYAVAKNPNWLADEFLLHASQPALRKQFEDASWRDRTLASPNMATWQRNVEVNQKNLKWLHGSGVRTIGFGADSGANPLRIPGFAEHRELQLMIDAGLSAKEAITIATKNSAELLGLDDRGILAPDKLADFVVLDVDPATNITHTNRIHTVWHRGKQVAGQVENFTP